VSKKRESRGFWRSHLFQEAWHPVTQITVGRAEAVVASASSTRLHGFDWLRFWAILAVVCIHVSDVALRKNNYFPQMTAEAACYYAFAACLRFCVPVFFMMSAFLIERRLLERGPQRAARWKRYLTPLVGASLVYTLLALAIAKAQHKPLAPTHLAAMVLSGQACYHTWFLLNIVAYALMHRFLRALASPARFGLVLLGYTVFFALTFGHFDRFQASSPFAVAFWNILMGLPYYVTGIWAAQQTGRVRSWSVWTVKALFLLGIAAAIFYGVGLRERSFYNPGTELLAVSAFFWALGANVRPPAAVAYIGGLSLGIYLWHPLILAPLRACEGRWARQAISPGITLVLLLLEVALALGGSLLISRMLARYPRLRGLAQ